MIIKTFYLALSFTEGKAQVHCICDVVQTFCKECIIRPLETYLDNSSSEKQTQMYPKTVTNVRCQTELCSPSKQKEN